MRHDQFTSLEIERKFIVKGKFPREKDPLHITQGYFQHRTGNELRIRLEDQDYFLTCKERMDMTVAKETTCSVPAIIGQELLNRCSGGTIIYKLRHRIPVAGLIWEVDEYLEANAGLVVAEVELSTKNQAFRMPNWVGIEVTQDPEFKNMALYRNPL